MIGTILRISWLNLRRDRLALVLTFLMPILFFSVFAWVFGGIDRGNVQSIETALVFDAGDPTARALCDILDRDPHLAIEGSCETPAEQEAAFRRLRRGDLAALIVIPPERSDEAPLGAAELYADRSNPLAGEVVQGALQAAAYELLWQNAPAESLPPNLERSETGLPAPLSIDLRDSMGRPDRKPSVAFFAAGIGVMFLLFSVSGRSAILIEERENGVLSRMLASHCSLTGLLAGRWLFLTALGGVQVTAMFLWGWLAFGLELWSPRVLTGFLLMTAVTAAAAAAFGLMLSTLCRTRAQLNGVSVVVVLIMSALGGSMFPRFLMPEHLQSAGLATFNAWALDGYQKVFWYQTPLVELWPQLAVLSGLCALFLGLSRMAAAKHLAA
ncbi:hypothetical protein ABI59_21615 [Acidobacteria bacterium Mor1]|nr:hypothetical protein ABI59_21615 [Acidobacteria bacterium Mor1]